MSTFIVECGSCGARITAKQEQAGKTAACPRCRAPIMIVPAKPDPVPDAPASPRRKRGASRQRAERSEASGRRSRTRRTSRSTTSSKVKIAWALGAVAIIGAVVLLNLPGDASGATGPNGATAKKVESPPELDERIAAFRTAWNESDIDALSGMYLDRLVARRGPRLSRRLEARGWHETLPAIGPVDIHDNQRGGPGKRVFFFTVAGCEVETVWKYESGTWGMSQLILPKPAEVLMAEEESGLLPDL